MKFAPEGFPFIGVFSALTVIAYIGGGALTAVFPFALLLFMFYFFRDPERKIPEGNGLYVSPADGKVILIKNLHEENYLKKDAVLISIFMSPLDVHVNRSPCDGLVREVKYSPGGHADAYKDEAFLKNENIAMTLEGEDGSAVLLRQVAGSIARRAVNRKKPGDALKRGERFGIIKFSSRVDIYLPERVALKVEVGQKVRAGETVLAAIV